MKKLMSLIVLMVLLNSCIYTEMDREVPTGDLTEEVYKFDFFNEVDVRAEISVEIIPSSEFKVTVNGVERDVKDLNIRVINRALRISYERNLPVNQSRQYMEVLIEMPEIKAIDITKSGQVDIEDFEPIALLEVNISGASKLNLQVEVDNLDLDLSGASYVKLKKDCRIIEADLLDAAYLDAFDSFAEKVYLKLSRGSKANVNTDGYLKVNARDGSTVYYRGNPEIVENLSGGSKLIKD